MDRVLQMSQFKLFDEIFLYQVGTVGEVKSPHNDYQYVVQSSGSTLVSGLNSCHTVQNTGSTTLYPKMFSA